MNRFLALTLLALLFGSGDVSAQEWARKMFQTHDHDFGTVARGAKAEFAFEFENIYKEDIHIAGVRTSCGCTVATVTKDTIKTWETSSILAAFQTKSFLGQRGATLTVTIDKPFFAEVQLNVKGFIRSDVVFTPGSIDFGQVEHGAGAEKKVQIAYAGRADWSIKDVRSANPHFEVDLSDPVRNGGRITYDMTVHLKPDAVEGYIQDQIILITDDPKTNNVPLAVEGRVMPAVSVSPASLLIGSMELEDSVTKQLVVIGKQPFRITGVKCEEEGFECKVPEDTEPKKLHRLPVTFNAGSNARKISCSIEIQTDLGGCKCSCAATGTVGNPAATTTASK